MNEFNIIPTRKYERTLSIRVSEKTYDQLCRLAKNNNTNIAVITRTILKEFFRD